MEMFKKTKTFIIVSAMFSFILLFYLITKNSNDIFFSYDGYFHYYRFVNYTNNVLIGKIHPYVYPNAFYGLGYAHGVFYPDIFFLPFAILVKLGVSHYLAYGIMYSSIIPLSFLSTYYCIGKINKKKDYNLVFALLYTINPYFIVALFMRNSIGEAISFIFLPVVYLGFITLFEEKRKPYILSIGLAGILYCHLISAMLTTLSLAITFFVRKYYRDKKNIINLIIAALIFFSTTFMYFAPAIEFIKSQKIMVFQGYNVVGTLSENDISLTRMTTMWFVVIIYLAISIIYVITNKKDKESITNSIYVMILLFMCTELFPWKIVEIYIPFVSTIQFTFRILYLLSIPITIMITDLFFKKKMYFYLSLLMVLLFSTQSFVIFAINKPQSDEIIGVGEYLPDNYYINNAKNEFMNGDILLDTLVSEEGRNRDIVKKFTIKNKEGTVKLPVLYYIGYTVKDEKGEALEYYQSEDGFISIDNIQEDTTIIVEYTKTPIQKISEITSVLSMITLYFFTRRKQ